MSNSPIATAPHLMSWASMCEDNTFEQAKTAATMPFIHPHIALMPDAHLGKGATVGSVIPTLHTIMPAAVGVDIGCGMIAHRTDVHVDATLDWGLNRAELRRGIEARVPLSPGKYNESIRESAWEHVHALAAHADRVGFDPAKYAGNWQKQLGSLGGGNHFIEVSTDQHGYLWLFLHSGSRGVGNKIAQHHIKVAQALCEKWWINLPDKDLAYLVEGTEEFWDYIRQLRWAQDFALRNREEMMTRVEEAFAEWIGGSTTITEKVNCHHNYTEQERHFGKDVWLSRKGAIDAGEGVRGLIPGSMGDLSYVVTGKGNRLALNSAPHGAGRQLSRSKAKGAFNLDEMRERMAGIEWNDDEAFLDEHPGAYKPIDRVMADAESLVSVDYELRQIVNVKGE